MRNNITYDNNKRIVNNTLVLYFPMLFLMAVTLYASRVVIIALGYEDYGIYSAEVFFVMFGLILLFLLLSTIS